VFDYGPLIKWGLIVLAIIASYAAAFYAGVQYKQRDWDASIMRQATQTASDIIARANNTNMETTKLVEVQGRTKTIVRTVEKEVVRYVSRCDVDAEFERVWDAVGRMRDDANDGVSAPDAATSDALVSEGRTVACAAVIRAWHDAVAKWRERDDQFKALSSWVVSDYQLQLHHRKDH